MQEYSIGIDGKMMMVGMGYILACIICVIALFLIAEPAPTPIESTPVIQCAN